MSDTLLMMEVGTGTAVVRTGTGFRGGHVATP